MHLGQTESGAAAHFPQATSEGPSPWATGPGQTTAAGTGQSIPVAGLWRPCHENFM